MLTAVIQAIIALTLESYVALSLVCPSSHANRDSVEMS